MTVFKLYPNWYDEADDQVFVRGDLFLMSVKTSQTLTSPVAIDSARMAAVVDASQKMLNFFNRKTRTDFRDFFKAEAYYKDSYPGAKVRILVSLKKTDLLQFEPRGSMFIGDNYKKITTTLKELLQVKAEIDSKRRIS